MIEKEKIASIVEEFIQDTPIFLVDVLVRTGNMLTVEIDSTEPIGIDDCIALNKHIEAQLDRDIEDFELEVGSAGLTSAFKITRQYTKNIGNDVEVLTKAGLKLEGILKASDEEGFVITITKKIKPEGSKKKIEVEEDLCFIYSEIKHTKYLIRFK